MKSDSHKRQFKQFDISKVAVPAILRTDNPNQVIDYIFHQVHTISFGELVILVKPEDAFSVVVDQTVFCRLTLPTVGDFDQKMTAKDVEHLSSGEVYVRFRYINAELDRMIAQYLIQFADIDSPKDIFEAGVMIPNISHAVRFSFLKTKEEYDELLRLRHHAYSAVGKISSDEPYAKSGNDFDKTALILIGKFRGTIVASLRLNPVQESVPTEIERHCVWPSGVNKNGSVEMTKMVTHPNFRGGDLLLAMFRFCGSVCLERNLHTIICSATDNLLPMYKNMAFTSTGQRFEHRDLNNLPHTVLVGNARSAILGANMNPLYWNIFWRETVNHLDSSGVIKFSRFQRAKLKLVSCFKPLSDFFLAKMLKKKAERLTRLS
jgi:predicted GNAT family N-acyltransferase